MGEYLAEQIRMGKLEYEKAIKLYPQYKEDIDVYLKKYSYIEIEDD